MKPIVVQALRHRSFYAAAELYFNRVLTHVPLNSLHVAALRYLGAVIGPNTFIFGGSEFLSPSKLSIAGNVHIGRYCQIDARGGITIGHDTVIASHCLLITADHDPDDPNFPGRLAPITIADHVWIASRAVIIKGVSIDQGAVVAAGAVVTKSVPAWTKVAGVPAQVIGKRNNSQRYRIPDGPRFY